MAESASEVVPGGRYLSEDGVTYHDANGNPLPPEPAPKPTKAEPEEEAPKTRRSTK